MAWQQPSQGQHDDMLQDHMGRARPEPGCPCCPAGGEEGRALVQHHARTLSCRPLPQSMPPLCCIKILDISDIYEHTDVSRAGAQRRGGALR